MRIQTSVLVFVLLLAGCGGQKHSEAGLVFRDWYVVKPVVGGAGSVAYGSIENTSGVSQTLKKVEFFCAEAAELHETITTNARVSMVALPTLALAPGTTVSFDPGHKHVMLHKITTPNATACTAAFDFGTNRIEFGIPIRERKK